jgi:hypothetical protein
VHERRSSGVRRPADPLGQGQPPAADRRSFRKGPDTLWPLLRAGLRLALTVHDAKAFSDWMNLPLDAVTEAATALEADANPPNDPLTRQTLGAEHPQYGPK